MPTQAPDGFTVADRFESETDLLSYLGQNAPIVCKLPKGVWNFAGLEIPTGVTFEGCGWGWNSGWPHGGFGSGSVITGSPVQSLGTAGNKFRDIIFDGGVTVRKAYTVFDTCAFTGSQGLIFDQRNNGAPYYCTVDKSIFRGIDDDCITFIAQANANRIVNSIVLVSQNKRGIVAVKDGNQYPMMNVIQGCGLERPGGVTQIGSYIYGDFRRTWISGLYLDTARITYTDGAEIAFSPDARENRVWLPNKFGDTYLNHQGGAHTFHGSPEGILYAGGPNPFDTGTLSALPEGMIFGSSVANAILPPVQKCFGRTFKVIGARDMTVSPVQGETINGQASLSVLNKEGWLLYINEFATTPEWAANKIW